MSEPTYWAGLRLTNETHLPDGSILFDAEDMLMPGACRHPPEKRRLVHACMGMDEVCDCGKVVERWRQRSLVHTQLGATMLSYTDDYFPEAPKRPQP